MQLFSAALGPLQTNCYWLIDQPTRRALIIDPGFDPTPVLAAMQGYQVEAILLTHGHWDHVYLTQSHPNAWGDFVLEGV